MGSEIICSKCKKEVVSLIAVRCESCWSCDYCGEPENDLVYRDGGVSCDPCFKAKIDAQISAFKEDTDYKQYITCPWCGHKNLDSWEYSNNEDEMECGHCESKFSMEIYTEVSYSTKKIENKS